MDHVRDWLDERAGIRPAQRYDKVQPAQQAPALLQVLGQGRPGRPRKVARDLVGAA